MDGESIDRRWRVGLLRRLRFMNLVNFSWTCVVLTKVIRKPWDATSFFDSCKAGVTWPCAGHGMTTACSSLTFSDSIAGSFNKESFTIENSVLQVTISICNVVKLLRKTSQWSLKLLTRLRRATVAWPTMGRAWYTVVDCNEWTHVSSVEVR